ncbi:hypothetical protein XHC_1577 [Xanthomonas hortorum pv. carotae str. M081]|nr:hypothetical protein XHC_1577 [Xanthomonas hortorum pv. carotae str. M081]
MDAGEHHAAPRTRWGSWRCPASLAASMDARHAATAMAMASAIRAGSEDALQRCVCA